MWSENDVALARSLFTTWIVRTGRMLRAVPVTELTPDELIEFWADDDLGRPPKSTLRRAHPEELVPDSHLLDESEHCGEGGNSSRATAAP
jgi:hypothetical protein